MRFLKSYRLFEQENNQPDVIDQIMKYLPKVAGDPYTSEILPVLKFLEKADNADDKRRAVEEIIQISKKKFAGFDKLITMQEVMERFVNHYIGEEGILKMRPVKNLIRRIKPPVKKSLKADKEYRIKANNIDSFTKKIITILIREGIKEEDVKEQLKKIYEWCEPILRHFYHLDTVKGLKYMQPGVLFNQHELDEYFGVPEIQQEPPVLDSGEE